jgi:predicted deacetylase
VGEWRDLLLDSEDQGEYIGLNGFENAHENGRKSGSALVCSQKLELDVKGEFKATTLAPAKAVGKI